MREKTLYARLAWTGMRKNRRLYLPYLLSCAGMVLMFYILMGLSGSPVLEHMSGGGSSAIILRLGTVVIAVFALILRYTAEAIIRWTRRRRSSCVRVWRAPFSTSAGRPVMWRHTVRSAPAVCRTAGICGWATPVRPQRTAPV